MKRYFSAVGNQHSASADQIQVLASALVGAKGADWRVNPIYMFRWWGKPSEAPGGKPRWAQGEHADSTEEGTAPGGDYNTQPARCEVSGVDLHVATMQIRSKDKTLQVLKQLI